jgi:tetratricopeptide (TPR) repeat protein
LLLDVRLPRDAVRVLEGLIEKQPDDAAALQLLAVAYFRAGDRLRGMDVSRRALRIDSKLISAHYNMALACVQERQWGKARYYLDQALAIDPEDHALRRLRLTLRVQRLGESIAWMGKRRKRAAMRRARD